MAASVFRPSEPKDYARLSAFLSRRLQVSPEGRGYTYNDMQWKYWSIHPDWDGSRSYMLQRGENIEAHCAVLPVIYKQNGHRLRAIHIIDWAADDLAIGAGVRILKKIGQLADLTFAVGGSAATRKILPLLGFQPSTEVYTYALPVRPVRQAWQHQCRDWRLPLRLGRNLLWALRSERRLPIGWSVEVADIRDIPAELWLANDHLPLTRQRSPKLAAWFLASPVVPFVLYLARFYGQPRAVFLMSFFPAQAHIVDLWGSPDLEIRFIYQLAVASALKMPQICEVATAVSLDGRRQALTSCGFQPIITELMMMSPVTPSAELVDFQILDNDASFLGPEKPVFMT